MRAWQRWKEGWRVVEPAVWLHPPAHHSWRSRVSLYASGQDSGGSVPSLKQELRRLYKLIHPDLLQNLPDKQAINQRSFQLLQEYLNAAKGASGSSRFVYHFEFYIRRNDCDGILDKVEVSLPAPQSRRHAHQGAEILPLTRRYLGQLLSACGLSADVSGGLTGDQERLDIGDLFQQASEIQRQQEASRSSLRHQLILISNAFRLGRGLTVMFRSPVATAPISQQLELMHKLAVTLDKCSHIELTGCTIVIGDAYQVDASGCLWINHEDDMESWARYLHQADLLLVSACRVATKARCEKEIEVATLLGVKMIFTNPALRLHPEYAQFLNRVGDEAINLGLVGFGKFFELPVCVGGNPDIPLAQRKDIECVVDNALGYVSVPFWIPTHFLYKFINSQGEEALVSLRKLKLEEKKLENLRIHVRKLLRLRHLTFDEKLSCDQLMSACTRLSSHAPKFSMYTEGLSLHISDEYRLPLADSEGSVHLKWNFSLKDL